MIDEDMLCMALTSLLYGQQESLDSLIAKLTEALQKLPEKRTRYLRRRAVETYRRQLGWGFGPFGIIADDGSETVHWQVSGKYLVNETPACAYVTHIDEDWTRRPAKQLRITCPECRKLLGYARKVAARSM